MLEFEIKNASPNYRRDAPVTDYLTVRVYPDNRRQLQELLAWFWSRGYRPSNSDIARWAIAHLAAVIAESRG